MEDATVEARQYLTFKLEDEVFAVDIARVREVLEFTGVTRVPRVSEYMRGVINLRGSVVPVADLRLKFGMSKTEKQVNTCVIIAEVSLEGESIVLGALADSVQEVVDMEAGSIEPPPRIGARLGTEFIQGMGRKGEDFVIILDLDRVFSPDEIAPAKGPFSAHSGSEEPTVPEPRPPSSPTSGVTLVT